MLDMSVYYVVFVNSQLAGVFEDLHACLLWAGIQYPDQRTYIQKVTPRSDATFSIQMIPVNKIEIAQPSGLSNNNEEY
jgi:uncharacterized protein YdeI (YjbR/CyaY-like superfamily)